MKFEQKTIIESYVFVEEMIIKSGLFLFFFLIFSGTPAGTNQETPAGTQQGTPAGTGGGTPAGTPAGTNQGTPAGTGGGTPAGTGNETPAGGSTGTTDSTEDTPKPSMLN